MPTSTHLDDLKINVLTESQFDAAVQGGVIGAGEISMITDLDEAIQVDTMPTAAATELGKIYQFTGTTGTYTHGYFYECVSDGQNPATYSWSQVNVQPAPSGLPSQTGNSGKFLTTDGTDASWAGNVVVDTGDKTVSNYCYAIFGGTSRGSYGSIAVGGSATGTECISIGHNVSGERSIGIGGAVAGGESVCIGKSAYARAARSIVVGKEAGVDYGLSNSIVIGYKAKSSAIGAIQIGNGTNSTTGTMSVSLTTDGTNFNNYELLSANGTIPTDRFTTTPSADGTYVPTLTISSGVATRSWAAPGGGGSTAATGTLVAANWSSSSQTINVTGVTASNNVIVAPAPASQSAYTTAGIICTAQGAGTLTFTCTSTPSSDLTVNVLII